MHRTRNSLVTVPPRFVLYQNVPDYKGFLSGIASVVSGNTALCYRVGLQNGSRPFVLCSDRCLATHGSAERNLEMGVLWFPMRRGNGIVRRCSRSSTLACWISRSQASHVCFVTEVPTD